ncbi:MAG TPA: hypothetical protein VK048_01955 [Atopostipes sp.]|nr:hypothetical protein [Atopostipes sp.]
MRNLKLMITSLIVILGMAIYIFTIPTIDEESIVHVTAETGDEELLEDVYFSGYILDFSSFHATSEEVITDQSFSYLEKLDGPYNQTLKRLRRKYPDFIDPLVFPTNNYDYNILNSDTHLISGHFENYEGGYQVNQNTVYLRAMNKETDEVIEDRVEREQYREGDHVYVLGLYEEYPTIKVLYQTELWEDTPGNETSILSIGEYNFETKNYTENTLLEESGGFYSYNLDPYQSQNKEIHLLSNPSSTSQESLFVFNYLDHTLTPLEDSNKHFFVGEDSQLYALEQEDEMYLREYNQTGEEVIFEIALELEVPIDVYTEYPQIVASIQDGKLYIAQSKYAENHGEKALPTPFQVLDVESGENLLTGKIEYDTENVINATSGVIEEIGEVADY